MAHDDLPASVGPVGGLEGTMSRRPQRVLVAALIGALLVVGMMPTVALGVLFEATATILPRGTYVDDETGTLFTVRLRNTGEVAIGSARIERPSPFWTITACPAGPRGWTRIA